MVWGTDKGEVYYRDLEWLATNPVSPPRLLIQWPSSDTAEVHRIAFHMDDDSAYLRFTLAVIVNGSGRRHGSSPLRSRFAYGNNPAKIFIWIVNAVPNQHGRVVDLKADILAQTSFSTDGEIECICLGMNTLAYSLKGQSITWVVEWDQKKGKSSSTTSRFVIKTYNVRTSANTTSHGLTGSPEGRSTPQRMDALPDLTEFDVSIQPPSTFEHTHGREAK